MAATAAKSIPLFEAQSDLLIGYLKNIGIPRAEEIRNAEEAHQNSETRIFGGQSASLGQFPYQVCSSHSLKYLNINNNNTIYL